MSLIHRLPFLLGFVLAAPLAPQAPAASLGVFEGQSDVGALLHSGSGTFDRASQTYTLSGSGENMWFANDGFHFVWKKVSARDVTLSAGIALLGAEGDHHRKAVLMIRQSLDPDSAYADAAVHGDGLTSLQFRVEKGATTHEIEANVSAPQHLQLVKRGDLFYLSIGAAGADPHFAGGSIEVALHAPFYVGLGVCAHNKDNIQKAAFTDMELDTANVTREPVSYSTIETISVSSTDARVTLVTTDRIESPEWSRDGKSILFRQGTANKSVPVEGGTPADATPAEMAASNATPASTGERNSPDGTRSVLLQFPTGSEGGMQNLSLMLLSKTGQPAKSLATFPGDKASLGSSPWSPDGRRITFVSYQTVR